MLCITLNLSLPKKFCNIVSLKVAWFYMIWWKIMFISWTLLYFSTLNPDEYFLFFLTRSCNTPFKNLIEEITSSKMAQRHKFWGLSIYSVQTLGWSWQHIMPIDLLVLGYCFCRIGLVAEYLDGNFFYEIYFVNTSVYTVRQKAHQNQAH